MRKEKQFLLDEIKEKIDASTAMIVTRYDKLEPNVSWDFRDKLAKSGSSFEIVRKRIFCKAAALSGIQLDETLLEGHIGVVFVNQPDALISAKCVYKFSSENGNILNVLRGHIEGKMVPGADVEMLSKLPSMDEMRSQMLSLFVSPMSQVLSVLEAVMSGPLSILEQKS